MSDVTLRMKTFRWRQLRLIGVFLLSVVVTVVGIWAISRRDGRSADQLEVVQKEEVARREKKTEEGELVEESGRRSIFCEIRDEVAPEIVLNGRGTQVVTLGSEYVEEGARAQDNCGEIIDERVEGVVDASTPGAYEIKYVAKDRAGNESVAVRTVRVVDPARGERVVYLTFDDGPSEYTGELLDKLKKYGVKATFFVTGYGDDELIRREYEEGHTVALHTYSHRYDIVYANDVAYFEDLYAVRDRVKRITGKEPRLIRFPGGSSNVISASYNGGIMSRLVGEVEARGFRYADWNVDSRDAAGASAEEVFNYVTWSLKDEYSVVLQHDTKRASVEAIERIIEYGIENGYTFLPMDDESFLAHHGVNN